MTHIVLDVDISSLRTEELNHFQVAMSCSPVQRGVSMLEWRGGRGGEGGEVEGGGKVIEGRRRGNITQ